MSKGGFFSGLGKQAKKFGGDIISNLKVDGGASQVAKSVAGKEASALRQNLRPIAEHIYSTSGTADSSMKEHVKRMIKSGIDFDNISKTGSRNRSGATVRSSTDKNVAQRIVNSGSEARRINQAPIPKNRRLNASSNNGEGYFYNQGTKQIYTGSKANPKRRGGALSTIVDTPGSTSVGALNKSRNGNPTFRETFRDLGDTYTDVYNTNSDSKKHNTSDPFFKYGNKAKGYGTAGAKMGKEYFWDGASASQRVTRIGAGVAGYAGVNMVGRALNGGTATRNNKGERDIAGIPFI